MHFITTFVALLAITPALCAPTPAPTGETVESLAASANVSIHPYYTLLSDIILTSYLL
jgi:hypothetical protein